MDLFTIGMARSKTSGGAADYHICSSSEYSSVTGLPIVSNPVPNRLYLVPINEGSGNNNYNEYYYKNGNWELFGNGTKQIEFDSSPKQGSENAVTSGGVHAALSGISEDLGELETRVNNTISSVGSPLIATTAADMTNIDKVYVYQGEETGYTAGNWYYYNGTAWVSGGVYNATAVSTDKTLSVENSAADAKVVGDSLNNLINVSTTQPSGSDNRLWINPNDNDTIEIPTQQEMVQFETSVESNVNGLSESFAPRFDNATAYSIGDYVVNNGVLYKFKSNHAAGVWTGNDVTVIKAMDEVDSLKEDLSAVISIYSPDKIYSYGDLVLHDHECYMRTVQLNKPDGNFASYNWKKITFNEFVALIVNNYGKIIADQIPVEPLIDGYYVSISAANFGKFASYSDWCRTGFIYVHGIKAITAVSSAKSSYNVFYDFNKDPIAGASFIIDTAKTNIDVPENAYYMVLSNTSNGMANTEIVIAEDQDVLKISSQNLTYEQQNLVRANIGAASLKTQLNLQDKTNELDDICMSVTETTQNLYNPKNVLYGKYLDLSTGDILDDEHYNVSELYTIPSGKTIYMTGYMESAETPSRMHANTCRANVVYKKDGTIIANNNAAGAYKYTNDTDEEVGFRYQFWGTNAARTVTDIYVTIIDDPSTVSDSFYVPYEVTLKKDIFFVYPASPSFFVEEIEDTVNKIIPLIDAPSLSYAFVTDTHINPSNSINVEYTKVTFANLKAVCDRIHLSGIVHGGDLMQTEWYAPHGSVDEGTQDDTNIWLNYIRMMMLQAHNRVYIVNGNHDGINGYAPDVDLYGPLLSHNEDYVKRNSSNPYFYTDDEKTNVRTIFLSIPDKDSTVTNPYGRGMSNLQLAWLKSVLDTTPIGYNILIFSHVDPRCNESGNNFYTNAQAYKDLINSWHNHTGDYVNVTGKVIAQISGHMHCDWVIPSRVSGVDFPVIVTTCSLFASYTPSSTEINNGAVKVLRANGKITQDSWSIFVYRPDVGTDGTLYMIRFGAGDDITIDLATWEKA